MHAQHQWMFHEVSFGTRPTDIVSETPDGNMLLDLRRFHELVPTAPTAAFPWPKAEAPREPAAA